jgi:hypothetical protein
MALPAAYKDPVAVSPPYVCRALPLALYVLRKIIYVQLCRATRLEESITVSYKVIKQNFLINHALLFPLSPKN